jgi:hypothetical protein
LNFELQNMIEDSLVIGKPLSKGVSKGQTQHAYHIYIFHIYIFHIYIFGYLFIYFYSKSELNKCFLCSRLIRKTAKTAAMIGIVSRAIKEDLF